MDRYSHVGLLDMNTALESLPNIAAPDSQTMRATGTTDAVDFGCTKSCNAPAETNSFQPKSPDSLTTEAISAQKQKHPQISEEIEGFREPNALKAVGLEPTTYGLKVRCSTN